MSKNSESKTKLKVYQYPACSTCKAALKYLKENNVPHETFHIVETPPSLAELRQVLMALKVEGKGLKSLFNTSGAVYKEMGLSAKFGAMSEDQALELLAKNGKLIKRPFVVSSSFCAAGFQSDLWPKG